MTIYINDKPYGLPANARIRDAVLKFCTANQIDYSNNMTVLDQWGNQVMHSGPACKNGKYYINI